MLVIFFSLPVTWERLVFHFMHQLFLGGPRNFIMLYQHLLLQLFGTNDLQSLSSRRLKSFLLPLPRVNSKRSLLPTLLLIPPLWSHCPQSPSCQASKCSRQSKSLETSSGCCCWGDCEPKKGSTLIPKGETSFSHSSRGLTVKRFRQGFLHGSTWN